MCENLPSRVEIDVNIWVHIKLAHFLFHEVTIFLANIENLTWVGPHFCLPASHLIFPMKNNVFGFILFDFDLPISRKISGLMRLMVKLLSSNRMVEPGHTIYIFSFKSWLFMWQIGWEVAKQKCRLNSGKFNDFGTKTDFKSISLVHVMSKREEEMGAVNFTRCGNDWIQWIFDHITPKTHKQCLHNWMKCFQKFLT